MQDAVAALHRNLSPDVAPAVQVRAAEGVLSMALRATDQLDLAERFEALEQHAASRQQGEWEQRAALEQYAEFATPMTKSRLRALARRLDYDESPAGELGCDVLRERAALAEQLRTNFQNALWSYLMTRLPPGERPPRRLRRAPFGELSAWVRVHGPKETQRLGEAIRLGARRFLERYKHEHEERGGPEATGERAGP